jgi:hypothetical protein
MTPRLAFGPAVECAYPTHPFRLWEVHTMTFSSRSRYTLFLCAALSAFVGCTGAQTPTTNTAMPHSAAIKPLAIQGRSWMLPQARAIKKLLYVSDYAIGGLVYVFNYDTGALLGELSNTPAQGQCVDARGDVWITGLGAVAEYAHGSIWPTKTLTTNGYGTGCSVSPNGDLAVANSAPSTSSGSADVQVWRHASGSPSTYYSNSACPMPGPPGYDDKGNLYFESQLNSSGPYPVCLLAKGAKQIRQVSFNHRIDAVGSTQWDGKHIALTDSNYKGKHTTAIYRVKELGSGDLKIIGKTVLYDKCESLYANEEYWLFIVGKENTPVNHEQGHVVVGGNMLCNNRVSYWLYTAGGYPTKSLSAAPTHPQGESVSIAP